MSIACIITPPNESTFVIVSGGSMEKAASKDACFQACIDSSDCDRVSFDDTNEWCYMSQLETSMKFGTFRYAPYSNNDICVKDVSKISSNVYDPTKFTLISTKEYPKGDDNFNKYSCNIQNETSPFTIRQGFNSSSLVHRSREKCAKRCTDSSKCDAFLYTNGKECVIFGVTDDFYSGVREVMPTQGEELCLKDNNGTPINIPEEETPSVPPSFIPIPVPSPSSSPPSIPPKPSHDPKPSGRVDINYGNYILLGVIVILVILLIASLSK